MEYEPNMFRVYYKVMEGDNYAGGWGHYTADVYNLGEAANYDNIEKVVPIYKVVEIGTFCVNPKLVKEAIEEHIQMIRDQARQDDIKFLERKLEKLRKE